MTQKPAPFADLPDSVLVAAMLALDPGGFGGVRLRAAAGPERDAWLALLGELLPPDAQNLRCPVGVADDALLGGLDLSATLKAGRPVAQRGLLARADGGVLTVAMAERAPDAAAARIAAAMDAGAVALARDGMAQTLPARFAALLLDEGATADERAPCALSERCAFYLDQASLVLADIAAAPLDRGAIAAAATRPVLHEPVADDIVEGLCAAAEAFGVRSARHSLHALRAARAIAALRGGRAASIDDAALAARLTLAHRATKAPAPDDAETQPPKQETQQPQSHSEPENAPQAAPQDTTGQPQNERPPGEVIVTAMLAALPAATLAALASLGQERAKARTSGSGGATFKSAKRGRPIGVTQGPLRSGVRISLIDTLRAAAPWQPVRRRESTARHGMQVTPADIRLRRFKTERGATTIILVDASGSSAFQRLAEAKGAAELLLAQAYLTRAHVALVAFRKSGADVILPPTRSLSRARRLLADLAGGGGTPLASGIELGLTLAVSEKAKGRSPSLLVLTDGRPNVDKNGQPGRPAAEADALAAARSVRLAGVKAIYIDTAPRPALDADRFAKAMGAHYAALPHVDAHAVLAAAQAR